MVVRTRSRNDPPALVGHYERPLGSYSFVGSTKVFKTQTTTDQTGVSDNRSFTSETYIMDVNGARMNGGNTSRRYHNFLCDYFRALGSFSHPPIPGDKGNGSYATTAAARTSPSRPYVDVPVNVLQLGEIASLIRTRGKRILRELAKENLRYQFAIAPLVGDLVKLLSFQEQVDRRVLELERLRGTRGLRRTIQLGGLDSLEIETQIPPFTASSMGSTLVTMSGTRKTTRLVGAHCRWKPTLSTMHLHSGHMRAVATRAVLGLTIDYKTLWEIMPWSWLIDWGGTVGQFLAANRNIIGATLSSCTITRHTRTVNSYPGTTALSGVVSVSPMKISLETKDRSTASPFPTAHFPFLSGNQMGILASLYVTRR